MFTTPFAFMAAPAGGGSNTIDLLIVGGGGGGGSFGGGGGAGGYLYLTNQAYSPGTYAVTIGNGGTGCNVPYDSGIPGGDGGNSVFDIFTAYGGGGGGTRLVNGHGQNGKDGASGGGGSPADSGTYGVGGSAIHGSQGYAGGNGAGWNGSYGWGAGGGGGASAVGGNGNASISAGNGGDGLSNSITGTPTYYAGGGGGGGYLAVVPGTGGLGGGGNGFSGANGQNGTANTGGGGGGAGYGYNGGNGGSGIVIVRYLTSSFPTSSGGTITYDGSYTIHTFTSSGSLVLSAASPIPQDGLVLAVDANDPACYSGSGTTVNDLSPYANTGTFTNPSFSSNTFVFNTSNTILFDPGSQYGFSETWSYVIYVNPTDSGSVYWADKGTNIDQGSLVYGYSGEACRPWNLSYHNMNPVSAPVGQWSFVVFTKDANGITNNYKSYRNGVLVQELSSDFNFFASTAGFRFNSPGDNGNFQMKNFYAYNRALTAQEVSDIYNFVISE